MCQKLPTSHGGELPLADAGSRSIEDGSPGTVEDLAGVSEQCLLFGGLDGGQLIDLGRDVEEPITKLGPQPGVICHREIFGPHQSYLAALRMSSESGEDDSKGVSVRDDVVDPPNAA
jgi:hypothetical protein